MIDNETAAILLEIESPFWRQWAADTLTEMEDLGEQN